MTVLAGALVAMVFGGLVVTFGAVKLAVKIEQMHLRWLPTPVPFMVMTPIIVVGYLYAVVLVARSLSAS